MHLKAKFVAKKPFKPVSKLKIKWQFFKGGVGSSMAKLNSFNFFSFFLFDISFSFK